MGHAAAVRAVLFDLDDTLLDYTGGVSELWAATCRDAAGPAGLDAEALAVAIQAARTWFWGDPVRHRTERVQMLAAWGKIARRALEGIGCSDGELADRIAAEFHARRAAADRLFADALPCLDALRARGHVLGLVTNGDRRMQRDKLARHRLADYFGAVAIEGEVGVGKPEAAIFQRALGELGIAPGDAVMIGDNLEWDVGGAERVGIAGIWLDRGGGNAPASGPVSPRHAVRSLDEVIALVARLDGQV
jgi:putative hydrolase of the HAD superfamily